MQTPDTYSFPVNFSAPQRSAIGPRWTESVVDLDHVVRSLLYADDHYCRPSASTQLCSRFSRCTDDIKSLGVTPSLAQLNKTEASWFLSQSNPNNLFKLLVANTIALSTAVQDRDLHKAAYDAKVAAACYYHLPPRQTCPCIEREVLIRRALALSCPESTTVNQNQR